MATDMKTSPSFSSSKLFSPGAYEEGRAQVGGMNEFL